MIEIKFKDLKPGQHFGLAASYNTAPVMKLNGYVVTCIPDEEYGNTYYNAVSTTNGGLMTFEDEETVFIIGQC